MKNIEDKVIDYVSAVFMVVVVAFTIFNIIRLMIDF